MGLKDLLSDWYCNHGDLTTHQLNKMQWEINKQIRESERELKRIQREYSDYSDYSDYNNYSDEAERKRRQIEAKKSEIDKQKNEINNYKTGTVNGYLKSTSLKQKSGVEVAVSDVKEDGEQKIRDTVESNAERESASVSVEIESINRVLGKINQILAEDK